ncbi:MAG: PKD domain-containing protein, partial [Sphingobacteriales bacterium]|nr:PKD domain-containing protein [Sphingobacteriales bacterium]
MPNFKATINPASGCAPVVVQFTDLTTGDPTNWKWDLGNGTTPTNQNPSTTYFTPGKYTIKLIVKNATKTDSIIKTQFIVVQALPVADFVGNPALTGCYPLTVQFTDRSIAGSGVIKSWLWDFGDGNSSTEQSPMHVYTSSGNYNVTLRVINSNGCRHTLTKTQYVKINAGLTADFSDTVYNECTAPLTVDFINASSGTGTLKYKWDFGDGQTSTLSDPIHTYAAVGTYTPKLVVTNSFGCKDSVMVPGSLVIAIKNASFTAVDSVCVGSEFTVNNTSTPVPDRVSWDFGDSTVSTIDSTVKTYATAGDYTITMVSGYGACLDTLTKGIHVIDKPIASFVADDSTKCGAPFTVNFQNKSTGAISYQWNFG